MARDTKPEAERKNPTYVVAEVLPDGKLDPISPEVVAPTQDKAMDQVWDTLPDGRKKIVLAAFLASSYREVGYDEEVVRKPKKTERRRTTLEGTPPPAM